MSNFALTQDIKAGWLDALRSGKYQQGSGCLRDSGKYCCLGVLCDIINKDNWGINEDDEDVWGRNHDFPCLLTDTVELDLANMNDNGKSFNQIADYIERAIPAVEP